MPYVKQSSVFWRPKRQANRGAALIFAVTLIAIFSILGVVYVRNMSLEVERADLLLRQSRARKIAQGGVYAAIGDLHAAMQEKQLKQVLGEHSYDLNTYRGLWSGSALALTAMENRKALAQVSIEDENSKVNINHAPASVLQQILGVEGGVARAIRGALPPAGDAPGKPRQQWFLSPEELLTRGLIDEAQFAAIDPQCLTTDTVMDNQAPAAYININSASPEVMAAVLDVSLEKARQIAPMRPFKDLTAIVAAAEKEAATFNVKPDPAAPDAMPKALALESHCFRIISEGVYAAVKGKEEYHGAHARVEAVVYIEDDGAHHILRWNTQALAKETE